MPDVFRGSPTQILLWKHGRRRPRPGKSGSTRISPPVVLPNPWLLCSDPGIAFVYLCLLFSPLNPHSLLTCNSHFICLCPGCIYFYFGRLSFSLHVPVPQILFLLPILKILWVVLGLWNSYTRKCASCFGLLIRHSFSGKVKQGNLSLLGMRTGKQKNARR